MNNSLFFGGKKNLGFIVVSVLVKEYPLSAKKIYRKIKENNSSCISYAGVHKRVQKMWAQGVLEKEGKKFKINFQWIKSLKAFFEHAYNAYSINKGGGSSCLNMPCLLKV